MAQATATRMDENYTSTGGENKDVAESMLRNLASSDPGEEAA